MTTAAKLQSAAPDLPTQWRERAAHLDRQPGIYRPEAKDARVATLRQCADELEAERRWWEPLDFADRATRGVRCKLCLEVYPLDRNEAPPASCADCDRAKEADAQTVEQLGLDSAAELLAWLERWWVGARPRIPDDGPVGPLVTINLEARADGSGYDATVVLYEFPEDHPYERATAPTLLEALAELRRKVQG